LKKPALFALVGLAALGCATLPPCPARGGPAWSRWTSSHFTLMTDLDAEDAKKALRDFEELRAALLIAAWRRAPEPPGRITVVVFRADAERRAFVPGRYLAEVEKPALHVTYIIKSGTERDFTVTFGITILLELHYGLYGAPRWFDKGLASYLDTLTLESDGALMYGQINPDLSRIIARGCRLPFERLWQPATRETEAWYEATSWLAVHWLFNHEPVRVGAFQELVARGKDGRAAWREVFPELTDDVMDEQLAAHVNEGGAYTTFKTRLPPVTFTAASTPMDDASVHGLRALLFATTQTTPDESKGAVVRAEIAEALRLDPTQTLAMYLQRAFLHEGEADLEIAKQLVARHPDDALAWVILARARALRHEHAEAIEAWEQVRALDAAAATSADFDLRVARPD
jgi:hypothetical protein